MIEKIVLRLLAIKSRTTEELRKKLKLKGFCPDEIESVIQKFTKLGYLNDQDILDRRFESYLKRGYGPRLVALKFHQQGLKMPPYPTDLQKKVALELLKTAAFKKKDPQKQGAALQRRGFDLEVIFQVIRG
ncbi:MAG: regulatory protein RecX [Rhabdochlamydiaceae bacterium]|jgi:SOS response regulatory protein OraA/RecX